MLFDMSPPELPSPKRVAAALRAKALLVHERLCAEYKCPIPYFSNSDPLSQLVGSMLSHRTRNAETKRAYEGLRGRFPDWAAVRDAPVGEVQEAIAAATWPELKAPRIQQVLRLITDRRGGVLSLDFLAGLPVAEARAWLEELPGVGPKTSASVLSFSNLRKAALPVDSHHHRVAQRLGLIGPKVGEGPAHDLLAAQLPPDWTPQQVYDNHEVLMLHGQRCCYHQGPACQRCVVLDLCPHGQARMARSSRGSSDVSPPPPAPGRLDAADDADDRPRKDQRPDQPQEAADHRVKPPGRPGMRSAGRSAPRLRRRR